MRVALPLPSARGPPTAPRTLGGGPGPVCSLVVGGSKAQPSSFRRALRPLLPVRQELFLGRRWLQGRAQGTPILPPLCRSPCGGACGPTPGRWQPSARKQTTTSAPASTPCRWAGGYGAGAEDRGGQRPLHASPVSISCWSGGQPSSPSLTPCLVPAQAGPAGAERSGHSEHAHWPEGSAQGAVFRVAGGLPAAPGPEVGRPALAWKVHGTLTLGSQPALPLLTEPWRPALLQDLRVP